MYIITLLFNYTIKHILKDTLYNTVKNIIITIQSRVFVSSQNQNYFLINLILPIVYYKETVITVTSSVLGLQGAEIWSIKFQKKTLYCY